MVRPPTAAPRLSGGAALAEGRSVVLTEVDVAAARDNPLT